MSDLLVETRLDPEQTAYVQALRGSGEALMSLVEEVLDFSRIEAGRIDLAAEPFEVESLVQGVVELLAPRAQDKGTEISAFVSRELPRTVVAGPRPRAADPVQPRGQRGEVHGDGRRRAVRAQGRGRRDRVRGGGYRPRHPRATATSRSSPSSSRAAAARCAARAPGSASPSPGASSTAWAGASRWTARSATARRSASPCPCRPRPVSRPRRRRIRASVRAAC